MALSVAVRHEGATSVVAVDGEIDLSTVEQLEHEIATAVDRDEATSIVVDLAAVTFMDSTGISALLKGRRMADGRGKIYRITSADGVVRQVLDLTGVWTHLSGRVG